MGKQLNLRPSERQATASQTFGETDNLISDDVKSGKRISDDWKTNNCISDDPGANILVPDLLSPNIFTFEKNAFLFIKSPFSGYFL